MQCEVVVVSSCPRGVKVSRRREWIDVCAFVRDGNLHVYGSFVATDLLPPRRGKRRLGEEGGKRRQRSRSTVRGRRGRRNTRLACTISVFPRIHLAGDFAANNDRFCQSFRPSSWSRFQALPRSYLLTGARYCYLNWYRGVILNKRPREHLHRCCGEYVRDTKGKRENRGEYIERKIWWKVICWGCKIYLNEIRVFSAIKLYSPLDSYSTWTAASSG